MNRSRRKRADLGLIGVLAQLDGLLDLVGDDSAALFDTIVGGNPFAPETLARFVEAARTMVDGAVRCGGR